MGKTNLEALQNELEELKDEIALRDAIISHYGGDDFDIEEALNHVAFNRKGEIIAYSPPVEEGAEGGTAGDGDDGDGESSDGTGEGNQAEGGESKPKAKRSVAQALRSRHTESKNTETAEAKKMSEMTMKERVAAMRKEYPDRVGAALASVGASANSSDK